MLDIISQLKYDVQNIELKLNAIKKAKKEMLSFVGKPAYDTRKLAINNWQKEIKEQKSRVEKLEKENQFFKSLSKRLTKLENKINN